MKPDTQHLDYLISQYVDGCLDPASRKSLEQQLVNNPAARQLYKDHHDVQDLLDDWGNRIPMINWEQFDQKLAGRLEQETIGGRGSTLLRRLRPLAAAAALLLAVGAGYGWRAWSAGPTVVISANAGAHSTAAPAGAQVVFEGQDGAPQARRSSVRVDEVPAAPEAISGKELAVVSPDDPAAAPDKSAQPGRTGPSSLERTALDIQHNPAGAVSVAIPPAKAHDSADNGPSFP